MIKINQIFFDCLDHVLIKEVPKIIFQFDFHIVRLEQQLLLLAYILLKKYI